MELNQRVELLLIEGGKENGLNPDMILRSIEENLTQAEYRDCQAFLSWIVMTKRTYGYGNIQSLWATWAQSQAKAPKAKPSHTLPRGIYLYPFDDGGLGGCERFKIGLVRQHVECVAGTEVEVVTEIDNNDNDANSVMVLAARLRPLAAL
jgi:hypothetical protein